MHPVAGMEMSANDRSCVVRVRARNATLLLSGDIEQAAERSLLQRHGAGLKSDVLVVPAPRQQDLFNRGFYQGCFPGDRRLPGGLQEPVRAAQP